MGSTPWRRSCLWIPVSKSALHVLICTPANHANNGRGSHDRREDQYGVQSKGLGSSKITKLYSVQQITRTLPPRRRSKSTDGWYGVIIDSDYYLAPTVGNASRWSCNARNSDDDGLSGTLHIGSSLGARAMPVKNLSMGPRRRLYRRVQVLSGL
ncbi:hypothetical protein SODALDRAFT_60233 [Sodiomyces alkalinus F11]|uniref:Secreted protein n=1 Tax=Sodiomyces alkalinus (strain CBS 110278 / VKM F-3762 / F11) TaxID=1314773 RepID=A0A3N2PL64_SODAK|nr:hypothetical protein SODALDRAFT_60233 [Sodiomyces alkalinus F11]ROT35268.1 hypothetical protein SODALDRAFT_60233 [Sodiomyces alkalinus F11]